MTFMQLSFRVAFLTAAGPCKSFDLYSRLKKAKLTTKVWIFSCVRIVTSPFLVPLGLSDPVLTYFADKSCKFHAFVEVRCYNL